MRIIDINPFQNGLLLCFAVFLLIGCGFSLCSLVVTLSSQGLEVSKPLKSITYCISCPTPRLEGSITFGIAPKYGIQEYSVTAELVYCLPNHAELSEIYNRHQLHDRIVFVERGKNGLLEKIHRILEDRTINIIGIIIADDGRCNSAFTFCGARAGSVQDGGFASYDSETEWSSFSIPILLVHISTAERFRKMMNIKSVHVLSLGMQNITMFPGDDSHNEL